MGRILYVIVLKDKNNYEQIGIYDIRPRFSELGWWNIENYPKCNEEISIIIKEIEEPEDYKQTFKSVIDKEILEGRLYFKKNDKLTIYKSPKKK